MVLFCPISAISVQETPNCDVLLECLHEFFGIEWTLRSVTKPANANAKCPFLEIRIDRNTSTHFSPSHRDYNGRDAVTTELNWNQIVADRTRNESTRSLVA